MKRTTKHVAAIFRVDEFQSADVPWTNRITIKEIVNTEQDAHLEAERLNRLNQKKGGVYFWQVTRLVEGKA